MCCHDYFTYLNLYTSLLVLWGFTIANNYPHVPEKRVYTFFVVQVLMGIVCPLLFILFLFISVFVIRIITHNQMKAEKLIPGLMTFVSFKEGKRFSFWVIADRFYFKIKSNETSQSIGQKVPIFSIVRRSSLGISTNVASLCIILIISVTFILAFTYAVSRSMVESKTFDSCEQAQNEPRDFDCYTDDTFKGSFVNCTDIMFSDTAIVCYRFLKLGSSSDPIGAMIQAVFLYIACDKFLSVLFRLVTALYSFRKTKLWGIIITVMGTLMLLASITSLAWFLLVNSSANFLQNIQFFIISLDIMLAGLLMTVGTPYEMAEVPKPAKIHLKEVIVDNSIDNEYSKDLNFA